MPRSSKASSTDTSNPGRLLSIDTLILNPLLLLLLLSRSTDETLTCLNVIHVHAWVNGDDSLHLCTLANCVQ